MNNFLKDKRLILGIVLLVSLAVSFWAGSRVPQLNEKASMGAEVTITTLGFDTVFEVKDADPFYLRIAYTTVNWVDTNKKGMTFGVLFASAIMTLFSLFKKRSFNNGFANSALGIAIGTPLGVCVNCAAPIAAGMAAAGTRLETTLATMISSPTLNVIVLTMLFSLFPLYIVLIKIGFTLFFIIIVIPLVSRFLLAKEVQASIDKGIACQLSDPTCDISPFDGDSAKAESSWWLSIKWLVATYLKNFWFVFKTTVPLMLVAGFLGSVVIIFLPWSSLADIVPAENILYILIGMGVVGCIGIFLPVPISFDIIMSAILLAAGMPVKYVMVLLFTLGIYSVYSFFIVKQAVSLRAAIVLPVILVFMGVASGLVAHYFWKVEYNEHQAIALQFFTDSKGSPQPIHNSKKAKSTGIELVPAVEDNQVRSVEENMVVKPNNISILARPFSPADVLSSAMFTKVEGDKLGINEPFDFSFYKTMLPTSQGYGRTVSTGDINKDGWNDILFVTENGMSLYINQAGRKFVKQEIELPKLDASYLGLAALVDLDNDSWLDIYFTTFLDGDYMISNKQGQFLKGNLIDLPKYDKRIMTSAIGFSDLDRDGDLDAVQGNWSLGSGKGNWFGSDKSKNFILRNNNDEFKLEQLGDIPGVPIGILISDFNNDGFLDLIIGNDFDTPDLFYTGNKLGQFNQVNKDSGLIPHSTHDTMSITSADIDNDLVPEIFMGDVSRYPDDSKEFFSLKVHEVCESIENPEAKSNCAEYAHVHKTFYEIVQRNNVAECATLKSKRYREDCLVFFYIRDPLKHGGQEICDLVPEHWRNIATLCQGNLSDVYIPAKEVLEQSIPQVPYKNILLKKDKDGQFVDRAEEMGLQLGGFTWNAKFMDVDNDEWQDLYVANGWLEIKKRRESNYFYHNQKGKTFINKTTESGLSSYFATSSYSYVDIDNDGDTDIITVPMNGPIQVFVNNNSSINSIDITLRDEQGNSHGIGSKIIIYYGDDNSRHQMREMQASGGYLSFDASVAHFGLGEFKKVNKVEVVWSTGEKSVIEGDFAVGSLYQIERTN